jgi:hypothetical protein
MPRLINPGRGRLGEATLPDMTRPILLRGRESRLEKFFCENLKLRVRKSYGRGELRRSVAQTRRPPQTHKNRNLCTQSRFPLVAPVSRFIR